jgi:hypothetical protein
MNVGTIFENVAGSDQLTSLGSMTVAEARLKLTEQFAAEAAAPAGPTPGPGQQQLFAHSAAQPTGFDRTPVEGDDSTYLPETGEHAEPGRGSTDEVDGRGGSREGYDRGYGGGSSDDSARGESF